MKLLNGTGEKFHHLAGAAGSGNGNQDPVFEKIPIIFKIKEQIARCEGERGNIQAKIGGKGGGLGEAEAGAAADKDNPLSFPGCEEGRDFFLSFFHAPACFFEGFILGE